MSRRLPAGSPEWDETEFGSNRLINLALAAVFLAVTMGLPGASLADTSIRCLRLDDQEPIVLESLSAKQRAEAHSIQEQAALIAKHRGFAGPASLIRLKSNDPGNPILAAWVPDPEGGAAALILRAGRSDQIHSLVDGSPVFVRVPNEPVFRHSGMKETGFSYQFYDRANYHIHLADTMIRTTSPTKPVRTPYRQTVSTGFSYGGLPAACRSSN